jgi:predicted ATPase
VAVLTGRHVNFGAGDDSDPLNHATISMSPIRIRELRLRNYRAFADVRLRLDDVTFLVGRNGAGKSTLLDAFSFISEALTDSLGTALERRGNLEGVSRRQAGKDTKSDVSIAVVFESRGATGVYGFRLGFGPGKSNYMVKQEVLDSGAARLNRNDRTVRIGLARKPPTSLDADADWTHVKSVVNNDIISPAFGSLVFPLLTVASGVWKSIFDTLSGISFHQFSPQVMQAEPNIGGEDRLNRNGSNAGDVLKRVSPKDRSWIVESLQAAVPGIRDVRATARAGRRVIVFEQESEGGTNDFDASMMSDGTVRSLGVLLALRQTPRPSIVLIDEIEDSLHPFAQGVILDAIEAASEEFPVVVSTHSPEVLSDPSARGERIRVVQWDRGMSQVHHLGEETLKSLKPPLDVGRLLRSNALWTDEQPSTTGEQDDFFSIG